MRGLWFVLIGAALAAGSCARMDYVKIPTPTQYEVWTDAMQKKADAIEGVRYYLPRPFLHLKEPVPVAQRTALVSFVLEPEQRDASGKVVTFARYKLDLPVDAPAWVKRVAPAYISPAMARSVLGTAGSTGDGQAQSGAPEEPDQPAPPSAGDKPPSELKARVGYVNETDPVTKLGPLMDVVYLPDFEEQVAIRPRGGLGKTDVEARLRNGWAAEVFAEKTDNSNLIPYVLDMVEKASGTATRGAANVAKMMATGGIPVPGLGDLASQAQSGAPITGDEAEKSLGAALIFRLTEIRTGQPGIYPIIKPREMVYWLKQWSPDRGVASEASDSPDMDRNFARMLSDRDLAFIRPEVAYVPCPPFTVVGFNATSEVFLLPLTGTMPAESPGTNPEKKQATTPSGGSDILRRLNDAWQGSISGAWTSRLGGPGTTEFAIKIPVKADRDRALAEITPWFAQTAAEFAEDPWPSKTVTPRVNGEEIIVSVPNAEMSNWGLLAKAKSWPRKPG